MQNKVTIIRKRIYARVGKALNDHLKMTGEKASVKIDYDAIINHLGIPNGDLEDYEIDHIVPLSYLLNGNPKMIEQAFHPSNLRWLEKSDNRKKKTQVDTKQEIEVFNKFKEWNKQ